MNPGIFLLRALQAGLRMEDLEQLDEGMVMDVIIESANDHEHFDTVASQSNFDRF